MVKQNHKKIAIIGNAGSGKTTLAFQLHEKLNLSLYHLDLYYWLPGWERIGIEKFSAIHSDLCKKDAWIMEGIYMKVLSERILHADVVIFLDTPRYRCMYYVLKRAVLNWGKVVPGSPPGCKQRILDRKFFEFLHWVWSFNKRYRQMIMDLLGEQSNDGKQIYILKSPKDITAFVRDLC